MKLTTALMSALGVIAVPAAPSSLATWAGLITGILSIPVPSNMAYAADMPIPYKAPPPPFGYSWGGFYGGINGGYGFGDANDGSLVGSDPLVATGIGTRTFKTPVPIGNWNVPGDFPMRDRGGLFGGQLGYNWVPTPGLLLGVETDIQWANIGSTSNLASGPALSFALPPGVSWTNSLTASQSQQLNWFGTTRARAGLIANQDLLLYVTGGVAYGGVSASTNVGGLTQLALGGTSIGANLTGAGTDSETRIGWAAGAGAEYHLGGGWSVKGEWIHLDLGSFSYPVVFTQTAHIGTTPVHLNPLGASSASQQLVDEIWRVGVNYKFVTN